jgi:hypothetical protein
VRRALWLLCACLACTPADPTGAAGAFDEGGLRAPPRPGFEAVADALQPTCGTLDCHGRSARNLRLYGGRGLRLDSDDNAAERPTTRAEYDATYWSIVGLEPEVLTAVVSDGGDRPERLSLVRKGRGLDHHKGGQLSKPDDGYDRCLRSWLAGTIDESTCRGVADALRPVVRGL